MELVKNEQVEQPKVAEAPKVDVSKVRCQMCSEVGKWKSVDQYRYKPSGMHLCESCGFVTYPDVLQKTADLTEFYREEYREPPGYQNLVTGERKLYYHGAFLEDLFARWKAEKKEPVVFEVGAAFGMFLNWIRQEFPQAKVSGSELTKSMVRNAYHMYGLRLVDEIDTKTKYDMIASYKVAEHMPNFDQELAKYAQCLAPGGHLYISVPTWFNRLSNFGVSGFSIEYYYHKNHINVWTREAFENLLARAGFEIVQQNHTYYDDTYLCVVNEEKKATPIHRDDPAKVEGWLAKILEAAKAFDQGEYGKAIEAWPNFPDGHIAHFEMNRAQFHPHGIDWLLENVGARALRECPKSAQIVMLNADLCMRYGQWEKAMEFLNKALDWRPMDGQFLLLVAQCFRQLAMQIPDAKERTRLILEARNVCATAAKVAQGAKQEALTWMMNDNARIPTPFEVPPRAKP